MHSSDKDRIHDPTDGLHIAVIGLNHATAPLPVREGIAFADTEVTGALENLAAIDNVTECVLLSTCNRTEVYIVSADPAHSLHSVAAVIDSAKNANVLENPEWTYTYTDGVAVDHLFKVATGMDSLMVGEAQILTQLKTAYDLACCSRHVGLVLNRLFQGALHAGKRARTETEIGIGAVSISSAAVGIAEKVFDDLRERTALLIGAGETARLAAEHLVERGVGRLIIANRTTERAERLAKRFHASVVPLDERLRVLPDADILISVTSAPTTLFSESDIRVAMRHRARRPLLAIDLAVPRDIDPEVKRLENVFLYDIDALGTMIEQNLSRRRKEVPKVEAIIDEETQSFLHWYDSLSIRPLIRELRSTIDDIRTEHIRRYGHQFTDHDREQLDQFTRTLVKKILHQPLTQLRVIARDSQSGAVRLDTVRELFGLGKQNGTDDQDRDTR
jgi:glutamyl-tRNA reductase